VETLGIALALLGGLVAAPIFCLVLVKLIRPFPNLSAFTFWPAVTVVVLFGLEAVLALARGVLWTRALIGPGFFLIHVFLTFSVAPSLACALLLGRRSLARHWWLAAALCWFVGAGADFYQFDVADALYGIDGTGGPYPWPW
jgi:hypothetical protein